MLPIPRDEKITSLVAVGEFSNDEYLVMLTKGGYIKKTALSAFNNIRSNGIIAISLNEGDELRWVRSAKVDDSVIIGSRLGMAIHFHTDDKQLRPLGRATRGVKAMKLKPDDELIGMDILPSFIVASIPKLGGEETEIEEEENTTVEEVDDTESEEIATTEVEPDGVSILVITTRGYGKRVPVSQFRLQNRAGKGIIATKFKPHLSGDCVVALQVVHNTDELMLITSRGIIIRQVISAISRQSRNATGVRVQRLDKEDAIAAVALVPLSGEGDDTEVDVDPNTDVELQEVNN
ncbi:DNA gyrase C-terminal domain-containing protein, beta-propeller [Limnospira platensis C1]|nr:DNA gyrase C-terminal domain-containing protein, beta-propeller [Arthrospira platensis C1]